jgi:hypothetical protein
MSKNTSNFSHKENPAICQTMALVKENEKNFNFKPSKLRKHSPDLYGRQVGRFGNIVEKVRHEIVGRRLSAK